VHVQIPLSGANSIVGRAVVVHELHDDMGKGDHSQPGTQGKTSKTTGNAGAPRCRKLQRSCTLSRTGVRATRSDPARGRSQAPAWRAASSA
jgi:hypothetical protein